MRHGLLTCMLASATCSVVNWYDGSTFNMWELPFWHFGSAITDVTTTPKTYDVLAADPFLTVILGKSLPDGYLTPAGFLTTLGKSKCCDVEQFLPGFLNVSSSDALAAAKGKVLWITSYTMGLCMFYFKDSQIGITAAKAGFAAIQFFQGTNPLYNGGLFISADDKVPIPVFLKPIGRY